MLSLISEEEDLEQKKELKDQLVAITCVLRPSRKKRRHQVASLLSFWPYALRVNCFPEVQRALDSLCMQTRYDVVLCEGVYVANYRFPAGVKRIIDEHNVEYELFWRTFLHESAGLRKWFNWWESRLLKPRELALCRQADLVLTTSDCDGQLLKPDLPTTPLQTVPNGVDLVNFQGQATSASACQIVFTGAMNYYPNINAVLFFAERIWPLVRQQVPAATWVIVGREPPPEVQRLGNLPGVTVTGTVPDVRPYLEASTVAVVPLQIGSGTRLKILEAFAMRKAVVSTSLGCEGLAVRSGTHLLLADRPVEFAQKVGLLLQDADLRTRLGQAARTLVEDCYSWEACGALLLDALEKSVQERG